ncbi:hypothetical protein RV18_GL003227 [Enterococcus termitis]|nr:hypothetical protein RV18_GL003227 [Enterococcus termitis]
MKAEFSGRNTSCSTAISISEIAQFLNFDGGIAFFEIKRVGEAEVSIPSEAAPM